MSVPVQYHLRSLWVRRGSSALTVVSVGLSVAILVLVLSLAQGFEISLTAAGRPDNVLFMRKAATSEGESGFNRETAAILLARPEFARAADGSALAMGEMYAGIALDKVEADRTATSLGVRSMTNVSIRGTTAAALQVRDGVRVVEGRMFRPGSEEVAVGRSLIGRVKGCQVGGAVEFAGRSMPVVGVLEGGAANSEIWGDAETFLQVFKRGGFSTVFGRLQDAGGLPALQAAVEGDPRLQAKVVAESDYLRQQAGKNAEFFQLMAYFLASIMAVGAMFGSTNTLLASLAGRSREIGTLLAMGYRPRHVLLGFLLEALTVGLAGGVVGILLAWPVNGIATGTTNWATFTEQAFAFAITWDVVAQAVFFAGIVGVIGGVVPAARAASLPPTVALRA
jgi:putative ABC transport system permease protein